MCDVLFEPSASRVGPRQSLNRCGLMVSQRRQENRKGVPVFHRRRRHLDTEVGSHRTHLPFPRPFSRQKNSPTEKLKLSPLLKGWKAV